MARLQRILCKLYSRDSWYSGYALGPQYTKNLYVSGTLICQSFTEFQPTILSSTPHWYFPQYHQCYSLQCATHATHASATPTIPTTQTIHAGTSGTPATPPTLASHPRYLRQLFIHASTSLIPLTLARHQHKRATHASTPPTKAHYPRQHATHASKNSPPFFKLINCVQLLLLPKQYLVMKNKSYMIMCSEVKTNPY